MLLEIMERFKINYERVDISRYVHDACALSVTFIGEAVKGSRTRVQHVIHFAFSNELDAFEIKILRTNM
jgi:hypothetical protein